MAPSLHSQPHALAVPLPFQGHIQPLLALSKKLASAGVMVTFANTHTNHQRITADHISDTDMRGGATSTEDEDVDQVDGDGDGDLLQFVSIGEEVPKEQENALDTLIEVMKPAMRGAVASLLQRLNEKEPPVSLLAFDFRLSFMLDLATAMGIPSIALWTQNAANFACNAVVTQGFRPPADDSKLFMCARGVPPLTRKEITGIFIDTIPPPFPSDEYGWLPFRRSAEPTWIVINTFEELEATTMDTLEEILGSRPLALGPLVNAPFFSIKEGMKKTSFLSHLEWLQRHPKDSVLYIAFGTIVDFSEVQLEELVLGLEACKQRFMWVFRADFCVHSKKYTIESLSKRLGNQGLLVPWTPQREVLSHPAVGSFLTHCGWNSTIEGIKSGVPMLTWPLFVDQFLNKRCVIEQWGIGLGFDANDNGLVTRSEVEKKIKIMMQTEMGSQMREKAKELESLASIALDKGGSSNKIFNCLKEHIWSFHMKR